MEISAERSLELSELLLESACCPPHLREHLSTLTEDELAAMESEVQSQWEWELGVGALEQSEYLAGMLIINANIEAIQACQMILEMIGEECHDREKAIASSGPKLVVN